ncbi:homoserine dehydrogenase [[Leptolyngbya] sp. PCC 7376]|uniref:homoserine dehydrogenase n=1 Tax=[Leptolyngbya] sp. PCC 7376 TaxID=111781 RepID=UPI00029ECDAE|nr:homoserine dehydrogenase [[Leptolyngbya] sp. PCC 7376]AFY38994.1 homoserine dehydrogenase [[Leptolyngbya] sp. PCC 7376]
MAIGIGLLGLGTVGTGTAEILLTPQGRHPLLGEVALKKAGVRSLDKPRKIDLPDGCLTTDLNEIVSDPEVDIVVELLGGLEPSRTLILEAIANGKHIVTANKAVIAKHGEEIFKAANKASVYVLLEAAVGGGIPIITPLKQSLCVNHISRVIGIINGTTNYILTKMAQDGADFAAVLKDAQDLGYAEADPTADVGGGDAADKISILASLAFGGRIKREDVYCEGITSISAADITFATKLGFVIKLLAIAERPDLEEEALQLRVHPTLVPEEHPLANVNGVFNAILVEGSPLGEVMLYGPGAGAGATASAVVSDIVHVLGLLHSDNTVRDQSEKTLNPLLGCNHEHYSPTLSIDTLKTRFYARFLSQDLPGVIGDLGTCFGNHQVSLESVVQIGLKDDCAEIVVVTHDVYEANFREALNEIKSLEAIKDVPSILRVL